MNEVSNIFTFKNVYKAYLQCRSNKRNNASALKFEMNAEENVWRLTEQLKQHTYKPLPSTCFIAPQPKKREIFAANFRDRVIHHLIVSYLEPIWERKFIFDSYACRKNKGTHAAVKRLQDFMRKVSYNGQHKAFYLHLDIKSFFISINKQILYDILIRKEPNTDIIWLLNIIIFHDCAYDPIIKGDPSKFSEIPAYKSLFHTKNITGLPIGNYTSQFFANVYLNKLDQYVKHELKCHYYIRYVDDFVLLDNKRENLVYWENQIKDFLAKELKLELNPKSRHFAPIKNGSNFLGYIVRPSHCLVRQRIVGNLKNKLRQYEKQLISKNEDTITFRYDKTSVDKLRSSLASYLGHFKHASTWKLKTAIFKRYDFLNQYFKLDKMKNRLIPIYPVPPRFRNLCRQYNWFLRNYKRHFIFFQVGCFYEFYGPNAKKAKFLFQLKMGASRKRLGRRIGFPLESLKKYLEHSLPVFDKIIVVGETLQYKGIVKMREVKFQFKEMIKKDAINQ
ncbi:MAG: hypothetical protein HQK76_18625 [Desulfobacterales bacterium]|nr:hypothetical protein [Desulfobacterales bacterium]